MHDPTFSVVIPTYGRPAGLLRSLRGLAELEYPRDRFEVIVVSDGPGLPADSELDCAAAGLRLRVERQDHRGPATARNRGATVAGGRYLAFIDDDCVPHSEWLAAMAARVTADPEMMVGGRTMNALPDEACPDATQLLVDFMSSYYDGSLPDRTRFFATSNLVVPADRFRELGGFDRHFAYAGGEDRDFCDRWHVGGGRSAYEPRAVVHHSHHLSLDQFFDQHFRYGRGALRFHRARRTREHVRRRTPLGFYRDLVMYPMARRGMVGGGTRAGLLLMAQVATAAGYWWERVVGESVSDRGTALEPLEHRGGS
jgi:GT2 family glycosyltransferase